MRIGINIPNELHRRMEPLKSYINVSKICREVIEERVASFEKGLGDPAVAQAIDQAWEEERKMRDVIDVDWWSLGCQDARSWAVAATLSDWERLQERLGGIRRQGSSAREVHPPYLGGVKNFGDRFHELHGRMQQEDDRFFDWLYDVHGEIDWNTAEQDYMSAWLAYTGSGWDLFLQKRREYIEERRKERSDARGEAPSPVLSENLRQELAAFDTGSSTPRAAGP